MKGEILWFFLIRKNDFWLLKSLFAAKNDAWLNRWRLIYFIKVWRFNCINWNCRVIIDLVQSWNLLLALRCLNYIVDNLLTFWTIIIKFIWYLFQLDNMAASCHRSFIVPSKLLILQRIKGRLVLRWCFAWDRRLVYITDHILFVSL